MKRYTTKIFLSLLFSPLICAETIPSIEIENFATDLAYILFWNQDYHTGSTYKETCLSYQELYWGLLPNKLDKEACYTPNHNNMVLGTDTLFCADKALAYFNKPHGYCPPNYTCPNRRWILSADKHFCTRPNKKCKATSDDVSEMQLLAAIVYGEASVKSTFEEKAAIANATVTKMKALGFKSLNKLVQELPGFSVAISTHNERATRALCANIEVEYPEVYQAVTNALDPNGFDYANGACFWDGVDLKTAGTKHSHCKWGYTFTNPTHNVLGVTPPPPAYRKGPRGNYNYVLESTAGYGKTIFWKYTDEYIKARGGKQCK